MRRTLLLADDSVTVQRVIQLTFANDDVEVRVAGSRAEALACLESGQPDIVLADIGRPEPDGYALAAFIRSEPRLADVPIVLLTSAMEPLDRERVEQAGCDGVLAKPFEPDAVVATVRALLARRAQTAAAAAPGVPGGAEREEARARVQGDAPSAAGGTEAGDDPLDAYFDRLDAAFARFAGSPSADAAPPGAAGGGEEGAAAGDPLTAWDPGFHGGTKSRWQPSLSNAFVAMFAPESGEMAARPSNDGTAPPMPSELIDEIARRLVERIGDDEIRRLVLETAERIVREEIEKIRQASGPGAAQPAG